MRIYALSVQCACMYERTHVHTHMYGILATFVHPGSTYFTNQVISGGLHGGYTQVYSVAHVYICISLVKLMQQELQRISACASRWSK